MSLATNTEKHGQYHSQQASLARSYRRRKVKAKRQIMIVMWSVAFAYLSLTATEADSASNGTANSNNAPVADRTDVYPNSQVFSMNKGHPSSPVLRQAVGDNTTVETDDQTEINILFSSTLSDGQSAESSTARGTESSTEPDLIPGVSCTPPAIDDFPTDLFTQKQRRQGYIAIHFLVSVYIFYCLAVVCDDYFVPSIECICEELHLPSDVAGATFMAIATSSPELFTNVIGTFITQGDIGVGTIVGSAVFNLLGVCACCGLAVKTALPLEWYPLTRDCIFYSIAVTLLIVFLSDRQVFWYEALVFVLAYLVYILVMYKNTAIRSWAENLVSGIGSKSNAKEGKEAEKKRRASFVAELTASTEERTPLLGTGKDLESEPPRKGWLGESLDKSGDIPAEVMDELLITSALHRAQSEAEDDEAAWSLIFPPISEGFIACVQWVLTWPTRFVYGFTVPDCRDEKLRRMYPITFLMCIVWIAGLSYVVSWTMTVIGHTLSIPDSVMGLTFLAAGTSVPEAVSSVIVARQGLGTMSISNSIGSNTFDILMCLGLPWLIKGSIMASDPVRNFIQINSGGLEYSTITLLATLALLYMLLACNKFYLDKKVGALALIMYACFLVFASMFEMNVFVTVNLPTCKSVLD